MGYNSLEGDIMIVEKIRKNKYLRMLLKETNDSNFMDDVNALNNKISLYCNESDAYYDKIKKHYSEVKNAFFNKDSNDLTYLEAKKIAYNYHLYLLKDYYNKICERLFFEKLSN